jgi:hypothetical protein
MYVYSRRSWRLTLLMLATSTWLQFAVFAAVPALLMFVLPANQGHSRLIGALLLLPAVLAAVSTLWLSVRATSEGITVQNALRRYRLPWETVRMVSSVKGGRIYQPSHVEILRGGTWALPDGYPFTIGVTIGLDDRARTQIVTALVEEGRANGFNLETAAGPQWEVWSKLVPTSVPALGEADAESRHHVEITSPSEVECVICGHRQPQAEMEPFGEQADEAAWYCRDSDACGRRAATD